MKIDFNTAKNVIVSSLNDTGAKTSQIASYAANRVGNLKDTFIKGDIKSSLNKNTVIGAAVIGAAVVLATKCIKGIVDSVKNIKNDK